MKKKNLMGIAAGLFAVATLFNMDLGYQSQSGELLLDNLMKRAHAETELDGGTLPEATVTAERKNKEEEEEEKEEEKFIACGEEWTLAPQWWNAWPFVNNKPVRQPCSGTVGSVTTNPNLSYNPYVEYKGIEVGVNVTIGGSSTTNYAEPYHEERVVCTEGPGNCGNGAECKRA